jgi:hypothetical protein
LTPQGLRDEEMVSATCGAGRGLRGLALRRSPLIDPSLHTRSDRPHRVVGPGGLRPHRSARGIAHSSLQNGVAVLLAALAALHAACACWMWLRCLHCCDAALRVLSAVLVWFRDGKHRRRGAGISTSAPACVLLVTCVAAEYIEETDETPGRPKRIVNDRVVGSQSAIRCGDARTLPCQQTASGTGRFVGPPEHQRSERELCFLA